MAKKKPTPLEGNKGVGELNILWENYCKNNVGFIRGKSTFRKWRVSQENGIFTLENGKKFQINGICMINLPFCGLTTMRLV